MKKQFLVIMTIIGVLLIMIGLVGCSRSGKDIGTETGPEPAPKPKPKTETIELTFAHPFPATHHHHVDVILPFVEEIMDKSEGRIKINVHPGGSITTGTSAVDDITSGAVDLTWTLQGYTPGRFPLTGMLELFGHFNSAEEATNVIWDLFEQSEAFREEYSGFKVFNMYVTDTGDVYTSKKPIRKPEDLIGLKLRSASPIVDRSLAKFGATTVGMPMPDVYDNIERGVVDGLATCASAIPTYRLTEVLKYGTEGMNLYVSPQVMAMSWNAWNKLTPKDQELFETIGGRALSIKSAKLYDEWHAIGLRGMEEAGMEIHYLSEVEKALFSEKAASVVEEYITELEGKGYAAREFYKLMISLRDNLR